MTNCESDMIKNLSRNIRAIMDEQKISMNELAKRTGLSFPVIRNIRDGKNKKINAKNVLRLATYFHVSPNQLLGTETIPEELNIKEEHVEFVTSFFEKEAGDFTYYNKCEFRNKYDIEFEECVVNAIHSFIEAHKIATGYYHKGFDYERIERLTPDLIKKEYHNYVLKEFVKNQDYANENRSSEDCVVKSRELTIADKVAATGITIKKLRDLYGISRKELADRTGLGVDCIYRIESGINKSVNYEHINLIAKELLCTPDFLLGESCDPTCNREEASLFYPLHKKEIEFRYVQLGHDLSYAWRYMDSASKDIVISMIHMLNTMYDYKLVHKESYGERLPIQEVFFREQKQYMEKYKNRGASFYTTKYSVNKGDGSDE